MSISTTPPTVRISPDAVQALFGRSTRLVESLAKDLGTMLVLIGSSALSQYKRDVVLKNIQKTSSQIASLDAAYVHLVACRSIAAEHELSNPESSRRHVLERLLDYGDSVQLPTTGHALETRQNVAYVIPRPGSVSPWSSKATDIALICKLGDYVERLERGIAFVFTTTDGSSITPEVLQTISPLIHDRMTQVVQLSLPEQDALFVHKAASPLRTIDLVSESASDAAREKLVSANKELGLALSPDEIDYLVDAYVTGASPINRNPTDAELFMFAQVNSEHCRHKIFNASWTIDDQPQDTSLFQMIRNTERLNGTGTISAYSDNAAVFEGHRAPRFAVSPTATSKANPDVKSIYHSEEEDMPILVKVETHNHPTAVSPYPGAATGSGGEIRDEGAVGRGSKPKAGLAGFTVSNLLIPGYEQPWETDYGRPAHIASALDIMIEGPLGASAFNNEFGRPALAGYFRTFSETVPLPQGGQEVRGYHKPIMIAGGLGNVRPAFARKSKIAPGAKIVVLGGPGLLIGLGGGAASSQVSGAGSADLDFASVQRDNAEMQRRCQQVIDASVALGDSNPIQSIHDVGAGGLSNALPELVHDSDLGAAFEIRDVLVADSSMSPMEIWCNESQERYVLAISPEQEAQFRSLAERERCPFSIVGTANDSDELVVTDRLLKQDVIRLKMSTLFGKPPRMHRTDKHVAPPAIPFKPDLAEYLSGLAASDRIAQAVDRVLRLPSVGSKSFLITIGDRSITGLVTRDQMVGPWQVPVADVAVTRSSYGFDVRTGEAMAMGERTPIAILSAAASARMAVAEALTNLAAAHVGALGRVKLSANWMCAASKTGEGAALYDAVKAVGLELCPALGVGIPVGKDSMSMSMSWRDAESGEAREVSAPLSLIVTAFAAVEDVGKTWTPQLRTDVGPTALLFFDLARGRQRLGGSAIAQVFKQVGSEAPDVVDPQDVKAFFVACQAIRNEHPGLVLAYHDRSDGGLFTTLVEMAFAGRTGLRVNLDTISSQTDYVSALFNEELGAVLQVRESDIAQVTEFFSKHGLPSSSIHRLGSNASDETIVFTSASGVVFSSTRAELQGAWSETSYRMQSLRDNPRCAKEEFDLVDSPNHTGLFYDLTFTPAPSRSLFRRPKVAILREQGVNGQAEMAWAFTAAGFDAVDVHMSDVLAGTVSLAPFRGLAACGGFSYGDVLGAGKGWAHSALLNATARAAFAAFFARADTFALGVCNGCQFLASLREIVPGARDWPDFRPNRSERFEARVCVVEVVPGPATARSVFLRDMAGSKLPVAVAHGEGRASFSSSEREGEEGQRARLEAGGLVGLRYVDGAGAPTEAYPLNPNGSPGGITGVQTPDGRVLALMPHPERVVALESNSWYPPALEAAWGGAGPWFRLFQNARRWCGE